MTIPTHLKSFICLETHSILLTDKHNWNIFLKSPTHFIILNRLNEECVTHKWVVRDAIEYVYTVRNAGKSEGKACASGCVIEQYAVCPGGTPHMKGVRMLVGNFELDP